MNKKSGFFFIIAFSLYLLCIAGRLPAQTTVTVWQNTGTGITSLFGNTDKITFENANILIRKTDASVNSIALTDFRKITFGIVSGLEQQRAGTTPIACIAPGSAWLRILHASSSAMPYAIYKADGTLVQKGTVSPENQININSLSKAVYILRIAGTALKFNKQ